jgi:hypothetical protein
VLCNPHVRKFYRRFYPLFLPDMLLARVAKVRARQERRAIAPALFHEFLHISGLLEDEHDVAMFLWFLDDGYHEGYAFADTLRVLKRPKRFIRALQRSAKQRNAAEQAAVGFRIFVGFCVAFDDLLARTKGYPLLQAYLWEYHAYWFRIVSGDVRKRLEEALNRLQGWLSSPAADQLEKKQVEYLRADAATSLKTVRRTVRRLTGRTYGGPIRRARQQIRRDSSRALNQLQ